MIKCISHFQFCLILAELSQRDGRIFRIFQDPDQAKNKNISSPVVVELVTKGRVETSRSNFDAHTQMRL